MTARQLIEKGPNWTVICTVSGLMLGYAVNSFIGYFNDQSTVKTLNEKVSTIQQSLDKLSDKFDRRDEHYNSLDTRVSVLEAQQPKKMANN
ncbi:MAG: hypothetical protein ACXVJE_19480 [Mucilaginibacter sp.]